MYTYAQYNAELPVFEKLEVLNNDCVYFLGFLRLQSLPTLAMDNVEL